MRDDEKQTDNSDDERLLEENAADDIIASRVNQYAETGSDQLKTTKKNLRIVLANHMNSNITVQVIVLNILQKTSQITFLNLEKWLTKRERFTQ